MQFIDLALQQQRIRLEIDQRIKTVLDHGKYIMGPEVFELEDKLCSFTASSHCISCASGTDALLMVLLAWGVRPGDAVFVPAFTFFATAEVVSLLGATPIFVDIEPDTFNISPVCLEKAIQAVLEQNKNIYPLPLTAQKNRLKPRAIITVDLFGQAADYDSILAIANNYGLLVLEDAAQSFGGTYKGKMNCALGCHAAATSFFPAKPLGCYGDGGAIFTDDDDLAGMLKSLRVHGKGDDKYNNVRIGINGRLDTIQAAVLLPKLDIFQEEIELRQVVAESYSKKFLKDLDIHTPLVKAECRSAWAQYSVLLSAGLRDKVASDLKIRGIPTNIYYPKPLHMLDAFKDMSYSPDDLRVSQDSSKRILALPFYPYIKEQELEKISTAIIESLKV